MLNDLGRRAMVSVISIITIALLLIFAHHPLYRYLVAIVIGAISAVATWEYAQFAKVKGGKLRSRVLVILSSLATISFFVASQSKELSSLPQIVFLFAILFLFALHFREQAGAIVDLAISSFGLLYIALPIGMILGIIYLPMQEDGRMWVAYLITVTKVSDMGAYFGGSLWGRKKLAPNISPGKTIEGAVFGLLAALVASFLFFLIGQEMPGVHFHLGVIEWICLGVVLGCIGQFGDLAESLLKRDANKKDSNILPGLGGVLDAVDSLLFNAPIIYFYCIVARSLL